MTLILIVVIIALLGFIGFMKLRIDSLKADYDSILEQASSDHAENRNELARIKTNHAILKEANARLNSERAKLYFRNEKGQIEAISKKVGK